MAFSAPELARMTQIPRSRPNPTALLSWAHSAPDWDSDRAGRWRDEVLAFVAALRRFGIDVQLDLHHASSAGVDWTRFGAKAVADCEWVIVALSPAWRDRWEGRNDPTVGAGVASEADALLSIYNGEGQDAFRRKLVLVILPSMRAEARVPSGLHGVQRFAISEFSLSGLEGLLRLLTGQPKHVAEPLGTIPELPPAVVASPLLDVEAGPAAGPAPASGTADRLVALLADRDSDVRYEAMSALGDRLSPDLLPVIEPLIDDADKYVRRMAVEYFGQLSG